jgi:hypothetical protein
MNPIFRLSGAIKRDPAVETWLDAQPAALGAIARRWLQRMRRCGADVRELIHDGCPVACVGDGAFGYVSVFRAHANVGFFNGAELADPARILEGNGKRMRHVKVKPDVALDADALAALIDAAYVDVKERLDLERYIVDGRT